MISYQLYSSRKFGPLPETLRMLADLGYPAVEGYGALFADAGARAGLAAGLHETGLAMPTAHVGLATLEAEPDLPAHLAEMGVETAFVPSIPPAERPSDPAGWRAFAERLAAAARGIEAAGLRAGWHNHDFEFAALPDGTVPMDHLLGGTRLDWQFDLAWAVRAGADPMDWIARHGDRISAVHVKDIAPAGEKADEDGWADPGTGTMDWPTLTRALADVDVRHWVMEHDNPSDDRRFAEAGLAAARALDGVPA
ncbi:sugar phosphate isomerase/epimerase [uncultured Jannaschia sp.]|uniref:sugar phosphate isomerase/epimerase family protein n=1 Tax=uncultured Jannaschia sp. TaxID=293347 RepID=UPI00260BA66D|nr:sugar phosphate isomerase/epimerase [uncultured Jannaschia sp.]